MSTIEMWKKKYSRPTFMHLLYDEKDPETRGAFDNMTWLAEVHLPIAAAGFVCAILYGNEDCPDCVELHARNHIKCKPVVAEHDDRANGLVVTKWGQLPLPSVVKRSTWWSTKLVKG